MIRIRSNREGFRRCGIAHSAALEYYLDDHFSKAELEILKAEPMLSVEVVDAGEVATSPDPAEMTVKELKELLEKLKIEIPRKAKKADLVNLVNTHTAPPPEE